MSTRVIATATANTITATAILTVLYPKATDKAQGTSSTTTTHLLVAKKAMEFNNELIFFFRKVATFEVGSQIIDPAEAAALPAAEESGGFGQ
ncbi:hypothetical protein ACJIZ3_015290 [Penstemon smallii]|uniref:Uncharacterized protein n=1 Tax=Penstemon smallii TaxID=265156 RepID=A0ABD3RM24_9LAMI